MSNSLDENFKKTQEFCIAFDCRRRTITASIDVDIPGGPFGLLRDFADSYSIKLLGNFPTPPDLPGPGPAWGNVNLVRAFGDQVPDNLKSLFGIQTPKNPPLFASFVKTFNLQTSPGSDQPIFRVGQFGCPSTIPGSGGTRTAFCRVDDIRFGAQLTVSAQVQAIADTTRRVFGDEKVNITAQADRIVEILVNNQSLVSGDISGSDKDGNSASLTLDFLEDNPTTVDFSFKGGVKFQDGKIIPDVGFEAKVKDLFAPTDSLKAVEARYFISAFKTSDLFGTGSPGSNRLYKVEIRDTPALSIGILGNNFTAASVLANMTASDPRVRFEVIATAVAVPEPSEITGTALSLAMLGLMSRMRKKNTSI